MIYVGANKTLREELTQAHTFQDDIKRSDVHKCIANRIIFLELRIDDLGEKTGDAIQSMQFECLRKIDALLELYAEIKLLNQKK